MAVYVQVDGQRVAPAVAADLARMEAAFRADTGCDLFVSSGTRTRQEQLDLWNAYQRYLAGGPVAPRAAHPDDPKAYHYEGNPTGPRAVDLRDSGADAGVTRRGTARDKWMERNAGRFNFENEGYRYDEPWHKVWRGVDPFAGSTAGGAIVWDEVAIQKFLNSVGLDTGGVGNGWGPASIAATKTFQTWVGFSGADVDGVFGPLTTGRAEVVRAGAYISGHPISEVQAKLKEKGLYAGAVDGVWGPLSSMAAYRFQRSVGLEADAKWGPASDAALFPVAPPPPPVDWNATSRPDADVLALLKSLGFNVADPVAAVKAFQASKFIDVDGVWGRTSDGLGFPPAGSIHGVDYSFARPDPGVLAARGVKFAARYLASVVNKKGITRPEYDALRAAGLEVPFIYEEDGKELLGGFDAGVRVAKLAEEHRLRVGLPAQPIYFNVDFDAPASDYPAIFAALDGIASIIGLDRTGLYAGIGPIRAAFDAGKIRWGFQTYAWSGGQWDARAQLQQWSNGQWGGTVDFTRAMVPEYGQNPVLPPPPEVVTLELPVAAAQALAAALSKVLGG